MECTCFYYPGISQNLKLVLRKDVENQVELQHEHKDEYENPQDLIVGLVDSSKENNLFKKVIVFAREKEDRQLEEDLYP